MNSTSTVTSGIKPLGFWKSTLYFGIPLLFMLAMYNVGMRVLDVLAFRLFFTFLIGFGIPSLFMLLAALFFWKREKSGPFRDRFRLQKLSTNGWLCATILSVIWIIAPILVQPLTDWVQSNWFPPNKLWVRMITPFPNYFMEISTEGNPWIYVALAAFMAVHIFGGELYFRGYIFPRQELSFGKNAWLIHALFWIVFRSFLPWELVPIAVISFAMSFIVQWTQNTWTSIIAHTAGLFSVFIRTLQP